MHNRLINSCEWYQIAEISIREYRFYKLKIFTSIVLDLTHTDEGIEMEYKTILLKEILLKTKINADQISKNKFIYKRKQGFVEA